MKSASSGGFSPDLHHPFARSDGRIWPEPDDYYHGLPPESASAPCHLLVFARYSIAELRNRTNRPHQHHRWVAITPRQGLGQVAVGGRNSEIGPGRMLLVPPHQPHYYPWAEPPVEWLFLTFQWDGVLRPEKWQDPLELAGTMGAAWWSLLERLAPRRRALPMATARAAAHHLAAWLLDQDAATGPRGNLPRQIRPAPTGRLEVLHEYVEQKLGDPLTLKELASGLGWSESHLRAVFRTEAGLSLGRYRREARLQLALRLLREGRHRIGEIGTLCGYSSIYSFSRAFSQLTGHPPRYFHSGRGRHRRPIEG